MIPYYDLNNIPNDVAPFQSIAGNDECVYGIPNYFLEDQNTHYLGWEGYDHGTHASLYNGIAVYQPNITLKEYIELLYSIKGYKIDADVSFSSQDFSQSTYTWSFNFSANSYPVLNSDQTKYLAPASRCLINNRTNKDR